MEQEDWIQLSSLQHYVFCPRQCGLIHVAGIWKENLFTAKGTVMHKKVDSEEDEIRNNKHIVRSLNVYSREYGLSGRADVVEFTEHDNTISVYPVEYKVGKPKSHLADEIQLCAQALCLEEMMNTTIPQAALFYGKTRHRLDIELTGILRDRTRDTIMKVHKIIKSEIIPEAKYEKKCDTCSIYDACQPKLTGRRITKYIQELYSDHETAP